MTDPIADMLTGVRNAYLARKTEIKVPYSKVKLAIAEILVQENYLGSVVKEGEGARAILHVNLKYDGTHPAVQAIKRESKPGHRQYRKAEELPKILNGYGIAIVSTSQGIMTANKARGLGIGGEVICSVY